MTRSTCAVLAALILASPSVAQEQTTSTSEIKLPSEAKLYIQGVLMKRTGEVRQYVTPELTVGKKYEYDFKIEYSAGAETVTRKVTVSFKGGDVVRVDFTGPKVEVTVTPNGEAAKADLPKPSPKETQSTPYLPLKAGNMWTYRTYSGGSSLVDLEPLIVRTGPSVERKVLAGKITCVPLLRTLWAPNLPGAPTPYEWKTWQSALVVQDDGVYPVVNKPSIFRPDETVSGVDIDRPVLLLPTDRAKPRTLTIGEGDSRCVYTFSLEAERVTVPAGAYDTVKFVRKEERNGKPAGGERIWYAKEVGIVKRELFSSNGGAYSKEELTKFSPGTDEHARIDPHTGKAWDAKLLAGTDEVSKIDKAATRRGIEKQLIDLESSIPAAEKQDAESAKANEQKRGDIMARFKTADEKATEFLRNKEFAKAAAAQLVAEAIKEDLKDPKNWRATDAADKIRRQIADLKKQLVDLKDEK